MVYDKLTLFLVVAFPSCMFLSFPKVVGMETRELPNVQLQQNKFKIGLEFQESTGLCCWAKRDKKFQKVSLFQVYSPENKGEPAFHVEIDGSDIEFVTRAFTCNEKGQLVECIKNIGVALNILKNILMENNGQTTFEEWVQTLKVAMYNGEGTVSLPTTDDTGKKLGEMSIGLPNVTYFSQGEILTWSPVFSPQVTIQHYLDLTIPLYLTLFGDNPYLIMSLPDKSYMYQYARKHSPYDTEEFWKECEKVWSNSKNGLIFLHAFTLLSMVPKNEYYARKMSSSYSDSEMDCFDPDLLQDKNFLAELDTQMLKETLNGYKEFGQINAKAHLLLMSRRPFSELFEDCIKKTGFFSYKQSFIEAMLYDNLYFNKRIKFFSTTNYGKQFFLDGQPIDFTKRGDLVFSFKEKFKKNHHDTFNQLLSVGIISTTMIRNFKGNIVDEDGEESAIKIAYLLEGNNFFNKALSTVQKPKKNYIIECVNNLCIREKKFSYDILSPPFFLGEDDAMGKINNEFYKPQDFSFGEAIIEVRGINKVNKWFLDKVGLFVQNELEQVNGKVKEGQFLKNPDNNLILQVQKLFEFIEDFSVNDDESIRRRIAHKLLIGNS